MYHDNRLVHLLPQVGTEDLDERNLECGDLAVHEDAREVELHLETDVLHKGKGGKKGGDFNYKK